jgi:uncharacterized membrane-anchored protein YitT (DUF2179 family)
MPFFNKFLAIILGSFILAVGIDFFLVPYHLLDGGIIGIGLIFNYLWGLKAGFIIILLSIPIFLIAWFYYPRYFYNSIHGMFVSSLCIDLLSSYQSFIVNYIPLNPLIASIVGGMLVGFGIGIMLRYDTSTGGTDLLAQFISNVFPVNVGVVIFIIDFIVIGLGGLLITPETFLLSVIAIMAVAITTSYCTRRRTDPTSIF